jgi:hypothetical protein
VRILGWLHLEQRNLKYGCFQCGCCKNNKYCQYCEVLYGSSNNMYIKLTPENPTFRLQKVESHARFSVFHTFKKYCLLTLYYKYDGLLPELLNFENVHQMAFTIVFLWFSPHVDGYKVVIHVILNNCYWMDESATYKPN